MNQTATRSLVAAARDSVLIFLAVALVLSGALYLAKSAAAAPAAGGTERARAHR